MLEVKEYDDAADLKQAVAVANKVVNDGVKFAIGHVASSATWPAGRLPGSAWDAVAPLGASGRGMPARGSTPTCLPTAASPHLSSGRKRCARRNPVEQPLPGKTRIDLR
ncbi:hypothetical protein ACFYW9_37925 [Streptomyces sp. NPDC002698]|uniref:hypothetical protein n=1 Tax=Streptomyces sp. NPDC002698 TaxID=3364660 RepID=UPI0036AC6FEB